MVDFDKLSIQDVAEPAPGSPFTSLYFDFHGLRKGGQTKCNMLLVLVVVVVVVYNTI